MARGGQTGQCNPKNGPKDGSDDCLRVHDLSKETVTPSPCGQPDASSSSGRLSKSESHGQELAGAWKAARHQSVSLHLEGWRRSAALTM